MNPPILLRPEFIVPENLKWSKKYKNPFGTICFSKRELRMTNMTFLKRIPDKFNDNCFIEVFEMSEEDIKPFVELGKFLEAKITRIIYMKPFEEIDYTENAEYSGVLALRLFTSKKDVCSIKFVGKYMKKTKDAPAVREYSIKDLETAYCQCFDDFEM